MKKIEISRDEIYELLLGSELRTIWTKEYGSQEMTDEDNIMDVFIPEVMELIREKLKDTGVYLDYDY